MATCSLAAMGALSSSEHALTAPEPQVTQVAQRWYSIKEVAQELGVSHDTVSRLVARGDLPAIRVSERLVRIPVPAFELYASGRRPPARRVVRRRVVAGVALGADEDVALGADVGAALGADEDVPAKPRG
jgi:excisionase family DNA binding protein